MAVGTPDEEIRRLKIAAALPPPPPEPLGRVKLRVLPGGDAPGAPPQTVEQRGNTYVSGDVFEAEGANAQYLIDGGFCEIVKHLRPQKQAPA